MQIPTSNLRTEEEVQQMIEEQQRQSQQQEQLQQAQVAGQLNESMAKAEALRSEAA